MRSFVFGAIVLCIVGCSSSRKVTVHRLAPGMLIPEVRAVAGKMEWVAETRETFVYRATFAKKPNCGLICATYLVLLTFDKEAKLTSWRRDSAEEVRRKIERRISYLDSCDHDCDCDCDDDHDCNRGHRSYGGGGGYDVYRAISGYGQALRVP